MNTRVHTLIAGALGDGLHHAYILEGERTSIVPGLCDVLADRHGVAVRGNPDASLKEYDVFGIDDARELSKSATLKVISGEKRVFIISVRSFTREAENALLKLLEDTALGTHFFIIVPSVRGLLPTLVSRAVVVPLRERADEDMKDFFEGSIAERLAHVQRILVREDADTALLFLDAVEAYARKKISPRNMGEDALFFFSEVHTCRDYASGRSPSMKTLLEHIALIAPVLS